MQDPKNNKKRGILVPGWHVFVTRKINPNRRQAAIAAYSPPIKLAYHSMTLAPSSEVSTASNLRIAVIGWKSVDFCVGCTILGCDDFRFWPQKVAPKISEIRFFTPLQDRLHSCRCNSSGCRC